MSDKRTQLVVFGYPMDTHYEPSKVEAPPPFLYEYIEPMKLPELVSEYKDLTLQIVEINKRRYVLAIELNDLGIKVPSLGRLCPEGIS